MRVPIIFCCHLRYMDVQQRPQHIAQLLAREQPVLYIEEPWWPLGEELLFEKSPHLSISYPDQLAVPGDLTIITPVVPHQDVDLPYVTPENEALAHGMVSEYLRRVGVAQGIMWFYSPMMAGYYSGMVQELAVVHDKMDELTSFQGTPPIMIEREHALIERADVMFAGGRTMFEKARSQHLNCYRFDSGVDFEHFASAVLAETPLAADLVDLPRPVLGYFGVIDERVDLEAIIALAEAFPQGTVFMGGPIRKISADALPRRSNLVYAYDLDVKRGRPPYEAGSLAYAKLPSYLKGFDICLIPFSGRTEATRNLSPTKTPEYAAGLKPIISGAIPDVVANWGDVVWIAHSPEEYAQAAVDILKESHEQRLEKAQMRASQQSWSVIVAAMSEQVKASLL